MYIYTHPISSPIRHTFGVSILSRNPDYRTYY